jgi:hypothetical protein
MMRIHTRRVPGTLISWWNGGLCSQHSVRRRHPSEQQLFAPIFAALKGSPKQPSHSPSYRSETGAVRENGKFRQIGSNRGGHHEQL